MHVDNTYKKICNFQDNELTQLEWSSIATLEELYFKGFYDDGLFSAQ